ncbi:uncharacterized protein E0L32_011963 [Thyridium curvatum]|uniref:Metallo-beta-lactamase domain-containing protein n=1 Tax=Thyridium curvatum TaxID=1093900 RepID=A0A507B6P6_9PEZI|nr:uncharacterized protein E0L32_011963 [Thyridium curvatum]TPX17962.1 hypothetical protein E0L32_011963 [Thyridium curvatum]
MTSSSPSPSPYDPSATDANLVCVTCGTQFPTADRALVPTCPICDDPRQFVPPAGQSFTTMRDLRATHANELVPLASSGGGEITFVVTAPKFAIGQRAVLVRTPAGGNVLWDCVTLVDGRTVDAINALGGLAAIAVSHPHFYSSHAEWSRAFGGCPVYLAAEDYRRWAQAPAPTGRTVLLAPGETEREVEGTGCRLVKLGGHFPGSMVLLTPSGRLLVADTLLTTPAGTGGWAADALGRPRGRPAGMNTFAFMWSIPNSIPLSGDEVFRMWSVLKAYDFRATHGGFMGQDIEDERIKERVLESMQIQTRAIAWAGHAQWKDV